MIMFRGRRVAGAGGCHGDDGGARGGGGGECLYVSCACVGASVFVAQAAEATTGIHFSLGEQITMMLVLMLTSKGVAEVKLRPSRSL